MLTYFFVAVIVNMKYKVKCIGVILRKGGHMPVFGIHTSEEKEQAAYIAELEARVKALEQKNRKLEASLNDAWRQLEDVAKENLSRGELLKTQAAKHTDEKIKLNAELRALNERYASVHTKGIRAIDLTPEMSSSEANKRLVVLIKQAEETVAKGRKVHLDPNEIEMLISRWPEEGMKEVGYKLLKLCVENADASWARPVISSVLAGTRPKVARTLLGLEGVRGSFNEFYRGMPGKEIDVVKLWDYAISQVSPAQIDVMSHLVVSSSLSTSSGTQTTSRISVDAKDMVNSPLLYLLAKNGMLEGNSRYEQGKKRIEQLMPQIHVDDFSYAKILMNYEGARDKKLAAEFLSPETTLFFEECQQALGKSGNFGKLVGRRGKDFVKQCELYRAMTGKELCDLYANSSEGQEKDAPDYKTIQSKVEKELRKQEAVVKQTKMDRRLAGLKK